jgi:hypothetical protein
MVNERWKMVFRISLIIVGSLNSCIAHAQTASSTTRGVQPAKPSSSPLLQIGPYYALIIGNQNYKNLPKLQTPVNDAKEMAQLLKDRYRFQTKVILDADRNQILTALGEYRRTLPENSSLLIYYAGHGHHDPDADEAYWLPIDAQANNNANWISADDITRDVRAIRSSHILVISDSCYSGYLVGSRSAKAGFNPVEMHAFLAKMLSSKSRNLMSSGGDEPVADAGAPGHSVFAGAVLDGLRRVEEGNFTASDLFQRFIQPKVGGQSRQVPQYSEIRNSGHEYGDFVFSQHGDFVFSRQSSPNEPEAETEAISRGEAKAGQSLRSEPQKLSEEQAKATIVIHDFFEARWNQGGGGSVHTYEPAVHGGVLTVSDNAMGLMWQRGGDSNLRTYDGAKGYIKDLNDSKYGGFNDWRLPTLEEAMSLVTSPEHGQPGKVIIGAETSQVVYHIDKSFQIGGAYFIWTTDLESSTQAWVVYFLDGSCTPENLESNAYVRAVRSNP